MKKILKKVDREKGYTYRVDKQGNVIKESYNWFKDPFTIVFIIVLLLSSMYYSQLKDMKTTEANFEESCLEYMELRNIWLSEHPGQIPTLEQVFSVREEDTNFYG